MKRFYKKASAAQREGGFGVRLDASPLKTPAKRDLVLPNAALAAALAEEWEGQREQITPAEMPLMQLVSTAIDRIALDRHPLLDYLSGFGESDLLCHRAEHPADLVERQAKGWQPWLDWAAGQGIALELASGIMPVQQPESSLRNLRAKLERYDFWHLTALQSLVPAFGSVILALAVLDGELDADRAFELAQLDETFQAERWGLDSEAVNRRQALRRDVAAAARYLELLGAG